MLQTSGKSLQQTAYLEGGSAVRFILACIVVVSHLDIGQTKLASGANLLDADFAVQCFFILSGYAMMHNYRKFDGKPGGISAFLTQRFFRIVVTVGILIVLQIVGLWFVGNCSLSEYVGLPLLKYFFANISLLNFLQPNLPCVFTEMPLTVVNGSLWTMKVEMGFYLLFPLLFALVKKKKVWLFILILCSLIFRIISIHYYEVLINQLPSLIMYFGIGMALYKFHQPWFGHPFLTTAGLILFIKNSLFGYSIAESLISFPVILLAFCNLFAFSDKFIKQHDYSFTIYLVHWPLINIARLYFFMKGEVVTGYLLFTISMIVVSWLFKKFAEDKAIAWGKQISARIMDDAKRKTPALETIQA